MGGGREKVDCTFAVYESVVQEGCRILKRFPGGTTFSARVDLTDPDRWDFVGDSGEDEVRECYR